MTNEAIAAFRKEISSDLAAGRFFAELSDEQKEQVVEYVRRSHDDTEFAGRSATALFRLRQGRIDFI